MQIYGNVRIEANPAPERQDFEKMTRVKARVSWRNPRPVKTHDREGNQVESKFSSEFVDFVFFKRPGGDDSPLVQEVMTPGKFVFIRSGSITSARGKEGKNFTNYEVDRVDFVQGQDADHQPKADPAPAPQRPEPAPSPAASGTHAPVDW